MANSNGQPYFSGSSGNFTFNVPVAGGNASINLYTGAVTLSNGSTSASGNVTLGTEKLTAGAVSLSISANGSDSVTINTGIVSATLNFQPTEESTTEITGATISGSYYGVGAAISIQESGSSWIGTASYGFQAPGNNPISNWINSYTYKTVSFDPTSDNPCTLLGNGMAASACNILESGSKFGTINTNEQQQEQENGIISDAVNPAASGGAATLAAQDAPGIAFDETYPLFAGGSPPPGASGIGGSGTGGTGVPAVASRGGYGAALAAARNGRKTSGTDISNIAGAGTGISPLAAEGNTSVLTADIATQIGAITAGSNQSYWELGNADGLLLNGTAGAIGGMSDNLAANIYVPNSTDTGASYSTYNAAGTLTSMALDGTGESVSPNNAAIAVANSSSATVAGLYDAVTVGNNSTLALTNTNNTDTVNLGTGDTVSGNGGTDLLIAPGSTLTLDSNPSDLDLILNPGTAVTSPGTTASDNTIDVSGGGAEIVGSYDTIQFAGTGNISTVYSGSLGNDTVYANDSHITFTGTTAAVLATDTVIGSGNTVTKSIGNPGGGGGGGGHHVVMMGDNLVQAMAQYAPDSAANSDLSVRPELLERPLLAASSYY
jgi:hypothetical protein